MGTKILLSMYLCVALLMVAKSTALAKSAPQTTAVIDSVLAGKPKLDSQVVYVDFWASWCVPCRQSFPWMEQLKQKYHDKGLEVIAISVDKGATPANKFLADMNATLRVVYDSTGALAKLYNLQAMPSSFVYGRDGKLRTDHRGFYPEDTVYLDSLLGSLVEEKIKK